MENKYKNGRNKSFFTNNNYIKYKRNKFTRRLEKWIIKHDPTICWLQEINFRFKSTNKLKVKEQKNIFHVNT